MTKALWENSYSVKSAWSVVYTAKDAGRFKGMWYILAGLSFKSPARWLKSVYLLSAREYTWTCVCVCVFLFEVGGRWAGGEHPSASSLYIICHINAFISHAVASPDHRLWFISDDMHPPHRPIPTRLPPVTWPLHLSLHLSPHLNHTSWSQADRLTTLMLISQFFFFLV